MLDIVKNSPIRNGNGSVGGRGVLRRKLTRAQRVSLAADVALGLVHVDPSIKQSAATIGVRSDEVRAELKARAAADAAAAERERQAESGALPIVSAWVAATPQGRAEAIQIIGRGAVWDTLASTL